tara:strand:+ start:100 stop:570 length:471 start_codon:yes stop_codon:yes gene_type:complete
MKCEVSLYVAGRQFSEIVEAKNYSDARETALARNPKATVISVNAVFDKPNNTWVQQQNNSSFESTNGGQVMSINDMMGLCIIGGSIWALITYTPWVFLGGGLLIGGKIGSWMPNHKGIIGTILAISLGVTGYIQGENLQNEINSASIINETKQLSV